MRKSTPLSIVCAALAASVSVSAQTGSDAPLPDPSPSPSALNGTAPVVSARGPHHRVMSYATFRTNRVGEVVTNFHSYVVMENGMHYWKEGQWQEAQPAINPVPGGAEVEAAALRVGFWHNLNAAGAIEAIGPGGEVFQMHVTSLHLTDLAAQPPRSVQIGKVKDSTGVLLNNRELLYPDAFEGCRASVRFVVSKAGLEQFVVLEEVPDPKDFAMRAESVVIQVVTEWINVPPPKREAKPPIAIEPGLAMTDEKLSFSGGTLTIGKGKAFALDAQGGLMAGVAAPVAKNWIEQPDGRRFLVEQVSFAQVEPELRRLNLVKPLAALGKPVDGKLVAAADRKFPMLPAKRPAQDGTQVAMQTARVEPGRAGLAIDYALLLTATNVTLSAGTTYVITGEVILGGECALESCVIKYYAGNKIRVQGSLEARTGPYLPAVFTAVDDDVHGEYIDESTGEPGTNRYAAPALWFEEDSTDLHDVKFHFAEQAIRYDTDAGTTNLLSHAQIVRCDRGIEAGETPFYLRNVLFHDVPAVLTNSSGSVTGHCEHLTVHNADWFNASTNLTLNLTNSLLVGVTNLGSYVGTCTETNSTNVWVQVGNGAHYLPTNTPYNTGTTNIDPALLAALRQKTTVAPLVLTNSVHPTNTTLAEYVTRATNALNLGFFYDPIDVALKYYTMSNGSSYHTLTLGAGMVIAHFNGNCIQLQDYARLECEGSPLAPVRFVRNHVVQEQPDYWEEPDESFQTFIESKTQFGATYLPTVTLRFAEFYSVNYAHYDFFASDNDYTRFASVKIRDSAFQGARFYYDDYGASAGARNLGLTNVLFVNSAAAQYPTFSLSGDGTASICNALFKGGYVYLGFGGDFYDWSFLNNVFDNCLLYDDSWWYFYHDYNAFIGEVTPLYPEADHELVLSAFVYDIGPSGRYYHGTNTLANQGYGYGSYADLADFTTTTNQVPESETVLDLGYHFAALTNGLPLDHDGDGAATWYEKAHGLNPNYADTDYDGVNDGQEITDGTDPLSITSVTSRQMGHWKFDAADWQGEEGQMPTYTNYLQQVASWSSNALEVLTNDSAGIVYNEIESDGQLNLNCRRGTLRLWFKPNWASTNQDGGGPGTWARLVEMGYYTNSPVGQWSLGVSEAGTEFWFVTATNGSSETNLTASISWTADDWHQLALTYSPTNASLFVDGEPVETNGTGVTKWPPPDLRSAGFKIGAAFPLEGQNPGLFEELETFNYPLSSTTISNDYWTVMNLDSDGDGVSDFLEYLLGRNPLVQGSVGDTNGATQLQVYTPLK